MLLLTDVLLIVFYYGRPVGAERFFIVLLISRWLVQYTV